MQIAPRQIVALGGGGFSMEPKNLSLDQYILDQARGSEPRVAFIPTASGDADAYIVNFYTAFSSLTCRPSHLPLFRRTPDLRSYILAQDVIYVGGGNTKSMLAVWQDWGLPDLLREAWTFGTVLAGISAGAICWFEQGVTDSYTDRLCALDGLGFLPGSCCPHYNGEAERRPAYQQMMAQGEIAPGFAIDDGAAIHFIDTQIQRVVASRPNSQAYRVDLVDGAIQEHPMPSDSDTDYKETIVWP